MGLYDVISDISYANTQKTETGDVRIHGVVVGIVAKNYDQNMPGRVCVTIPTRGDAGKPDVLKWARVAMPYSGKEWGFYFHPEVGDEVLLVFEQGEIDKPYIIGAIPRSEGSEKSQVMSQCFDEENTKKRIQTRHGSMIEFTDSKDDKKGKKDVIKIATPDTAHFIEMDNENKRITISDKGKNNMIKMETDSDTGKITIKCKKKLEIHVGDNITLIANADSGKLAIKANSVAIEATQQDLSLKAQTKIAMEGKTQASVKAASTQIESQGMLNLKGSVIKQG